jgi:hypothetical protein
VWPGTHRSDLFAIDDLDQYARGVGMVCQRSDDRWIWMIADEDPFAEEVEVGSTEHLSLDHLHPVHGPLDGAGTPRESQPGLHGVEVVAQAVGEASDETIRGSAPMSFTRSLVADRPAAVLRCW